MKKEREPQYISSPLNNPMLNYNEYYMSTLEKVLYALVLLVAGGLAGVVFYGGLFKVEGEATLATYISNVVVFVLSGGIAVKVFLPARNASLKTKRQKKLQQQFMNMMEAISTSLSSGNTLQDSVYNAAKDLQNQYDSGELIIVELNEMVSGIANGRTLEEMMLNFGQRSANEDIVNFANVISNCYRLGGNFGDVVRHTREIIGDKVAVSDEVETKLASNRLQLNVMSLMPIAVVAMLKLTNDGFAENLGSLLGVMVTTFAIAIFVAAYFWGQKIIKI